MSAFGPTRMIVEKQSVGAAFQAISQRYNSDGVSLVLRSFSAIGLVLQVGGQGWWRCSFTAIRPPILNLGLCLGSVSCGRGRQHGRFDQKGVGLC